MRHVPDSDDAAASLSLRQLALVCVILLAGCVDPPRHTTDRRPDPPRTPPVVPPVLTPTTPPAPPATGCPPGVRPIGVLAVVSDIVYRNERPAGNGERVCDGDTIRTSPGGVGVVLADGDRESDSVHVAEGTDPRFTWTQAGCLSVDSYRHGVVIVTAQRHCVVVRTPDTLMLLVAARVQFDVAPNAHTRVVPVRGSATALQSLNPQQVHVYTQSQLVQSAAAPAAQPQLHAVNEYRLGTTTRPAVRLPPNEIQRINNSVLRRAVIVPRVAPEIPR
jgi:hypothetical protein